MSHSLVGVGVEDVVGCRGEQHSSAEAGVMDLHHVFQVSTDGAVAVLNRGAVLAGSRAQDIGARHRFEAGAAYVVVDDTSPQDRRVHASEKV